MKITQSAALPPALKTQLTAIGAQLGQLRIARRMLQKEAATRAGISRATASLIENGAASVAIGQVLRYLDAIAPGKTLSALLLDEDPTVTAMTLQAQRTRARQLSPVELQELDF